jgi:antitoxin component of MazEF toxin-antitoxin module
MAQPIEPTPVLEGRDAEQFLESVKVNETLLGLVAGITPQNRHGEQDWGKRVGNEVW